MEGQYLLFIAVLPPEPIREEITALKRYIAKKWGPRHALKSPPHLTLQPPFKWGVEGMDTLRQCLCAFSARRRPFEVVLRDFGAFVPRVFFIKPEPSPSLATLFEQLKGTLEVELGLLDKRNERPFHPHLTLAHRDMPPQVFDRIWADFRYRTYHRTFEVDGLALLRWSADRWVIAETFPFSRQ